MVNKILLALTSGCGEYDIMEGGSTTAVCKEAETFISQSSLIITAWNMVTSPSPTLALKWNQGRLLPALDKLDANNVTSLV